MVGASAIADGEKGAVPKPVIAERTLFLRGDGTWAAAGAMGDTLELTAAPADVHVSGITVPLTLGETLAFGVPVYVKSDGLVWKANATTSATVPAIGVTAEAKNVGQVCVILRKGTATNMAGWNWTVGSSAGMIYLDTTAGTLTQTAPSAANNVIQVIGFALSADTAFIDPSLVIVEHV